MPSGSATDYVAWWGAILATAVALFELYKWRASGPALRVEVLPDREIMGDPMREGKKFIVIVVTNVGGQRTRITTLAIVYYKSCLSRMLGKPTGAFFCPKPELRQPLPFDIEPGEQWMGAVEQQAVPGGAAPDGLTVENLARRGFLYVQIYDSMHKKPMTGRVLLNKKK